MILKKKLEEMAEESKKKFPQDALQQLVESRKELAESGVKDGIISVKGILPPFDLEDEDGRSVSSEDLLAEGPLIMTFFRGRW